MFSISREIVADRSFTGIAYQRRPIKRDINHTVLGRIVHWFACTEKGSDHGRSSHSDRCCVAYTCVCVRLLMHTRVVQYLNATELRLDSVVPPINRGYTIQSASSCDFSSRFLAFESLEHVHNVDLFILIFFLIFRYLICVKEVSTC